MGECLIIKSGGGVDTSNATATENTIVQGYTCYVNDVLVSGKIVNYSIMENADGDLIQGSGATSYPVIATPDIVADQFWLTTNKDSIKRLCIRIPKAGVYESVANHIGIDYNVVKQTILDEITKVETGTPATNTQILTGYSAYVNGSLVDGTMPFRGNVSYSLPINGSYTIPAGYHTSAGFVNQSVATQGGWTVTPGTGNILACAAGRYTTGDIWCAGSGNLVAGNIRNGVNIFGVVGNFVVQEATSPSIVTTTASGRVVDAFSKSSFNKDTYYYYFLYYNSATAQKIMNNFKYVWLNGCAFIHSNSRSQDTNGVQFYIARWDMSKGTIHNEGFHSNSDPGYWYGDTTVGGKAYPGLSWFGLHAQTVSIVYGSWRDNTEGWMVWACADITPSKIAWSSAYGLAIGFRKWVYSRNGTGSEVNYSAPVSPLNQLPIVFTKNAVGSLRATSYTTVNSAIPSSISGTVKGTVSLSLISMPNAYTSCK